MHEGVDETQYLEPCTVPHIREASVYTGAPGQGLGCRAWVRQLADL